MRSAALLACIAPWTLLLAPAAASHAQPAHDSRSPSGEPELWQRIAALAPLPPATRPYENWFATVRQQRQALLARVRLYRTLYPGGTHRDEAVRLELTSLFELGSLQDGALMPLRERVAEILRAPPSEAAREEAAYWATISRSLQDASPTSQPVTPDADLLDGLRVYVEKYPQSRYVPRLASLLMADALRRDDRPGAENLLKQLHEHFPTHAVTARLEADSRRVSAVGKPFWPALRTIDGRALDQHDYAGSPVLILVWAAYDDPSRRCVQEVERFRQQHPELRVIGVSLDADTEQTVAACRELGLEGPQCNDRLGWGGELVRTWGIDRIPYGLAVDRTGLLVGTAPAEGWAALVREAMAGSRD